MENKEDLSADNLHCNLVPSSPVPLLRYPPLGAHHSPQAAVGFSNFVSISIHRCKDLGRRR